jgi:3-isopropylmalate dehydratase small subunit
MDKFTKLTGVAAPMPMINVDTDMIIPKQFLKTIKRSGLGKSLFDEMRYDDDGNEIADFVLNGHPTARPRSWSPATTSGAARRVNTRPGRSWISASAA